MGLCGQDSPRDGSVIMAALLPWPALCLLLLFLISNPAPHSLAAARWFPAHACTQHPLTSLNTHRCCACDLSSNRCYRNAKLPVPALRRMSSGRELWCREPWRCGRRSLVSPLLPKYSRGGSSGLQGCASAHPLLPPWCQAARQNVCFVLFSTLLLLWL